MNAKEFKKLLVKLGACKEAVNWCEGKTLNKAWEECTNPNWMFWLLENHKTETTDTQYRMIAVKCAREVQHLMKDQRSINALDVAERFANGKATKEELSAAGDAAWAAAWAAAEDAARDAARDAAWAAAWAAAWDAARAAVRAAAEDAAWAAARDAAWAAAWAAARDAARAAARVKQCDIIRAYIPKIKLIGLK